METIKHLKNRINGLKSQNSYYLNRYKEAIAEVIKLKEMMEKAQNGYCLNKFREAIRLDKVVIKLKEEIKKLEIKKLKMEKKK